MSGRELSESATVAALLSVFQIEEGPNEMTDLVMILAKRYVREPDTRPVAKSGGRPAKWNKMARAILIVDLQNEMRKGGSSADVGQKLASKKLSKREPWLTFAAFRGVKRKDGTGYKLLTADALLTAYKFARDDAAAMAAAIAFRERFDAQGAEEWRRTITREFCRLVDLQGGKKDS